MYKLTSFRTNIFISLSHVTLHYNRNTDLSFQWDDKKYSADLNVLKLIF